MQASALIAWTLTGVWALQPLAVEPDPEVTAFLKHLQESPADATDATPPAPVWDPADYDVQLSTWPAPIRTAGTEETIPKETAPPELPTGSRLVAIIELINGPRAIFFDPQRSRLEELSVGDSYGEWTIEHLGPEGVTLTAAGVDRLLPLQVVPTLARSVQTREEPR